MTEKIVFGGDCLARIGGKAVFVPGALPGETLRVEVTERKRDYDRARVVEILDPSPDRAEPECPLYGKCGGCNLMHCSGAAQAELRRDVLRDCFLRAGIAPEEIPEIGTVSGPDFGYRARFRLTDGGLLERGTRNVIQISRCPVAEEAVNDWLGSVPQKSRPRGRAHIFGSVFSGGRVTVAGVEDIADGEFIRGQRTGGPKRKAPRRIFSGSVISPQSMASVTLSGREISFDVRGFFQSNMFVLEKALGQICGFSSWQSIADIYSGCGIFSAFLSERAQSVTLVEHNREMLVFAERNVGRARHESYGVSGARWAAAAGGGFDGVVIDPPRSGMERDVREWLCREMPPQINAVSCDPSTHARDIARLVRAGYRIERLLLLDFYPQTSHVESLAVLTPR